MGVAGGEVLLAKTREGEMRNEAVPEPVYIWRTTELPGSVVLLSRKASGVDLGPHAMQFLVF